MQVERRRLAPRLLFHDQAMNHWWEKIVEWARVNKREIRIGALPFNGELSWHVVVPDNSRRQSVSISGAGRTFEAAFEDMFVQWTNITGVYDG